MIPTRLSVLFALLAACLAGPTWAKARPVDIREAVLDAELIIVGSEIPKKDGLHLCLVIRKLLYGTITEPSIELAHGYAKCPGPLPDPKGRDRVWCLVKEKGNWWAMGEGRVLPQEKQEEVERMIRLRLIPDVKILACSRSVSISINTNRPRGDSKGEVPCGPQSREIDACRRLAEAGPAAHDVTLELLKHESPVAKAWGCRLAHITNDKTLLSCIAPLLEDTRTVAVEGPDYPSSLPLSRIALWSVAGFAGKSGKNFPPDEAKAWCEAEIKTRKEK